jgi:hypothetical protein
MERVFTNVYETSVWGNNDSAQYNGSSGGGSSVEFNIDSYVPFLKKFIKDKKIQTVVDLGCGDFRCGKFIYDDLNVAYTGYDAYKKVIDYNKTQHEFPKYSFTHLDFFNSKESIVSGDLCILKDVIQHWSLLEIYTFLDYLVEQKKFKYILICNCGHQTENNTTIHTGSFRPLSCDYLPLKKYKPVRVFKYHTKEICVIES